MELERLLTDKNYYLMSIKEAWKEVDDTFPDFICETSNVARENNERYIQTFSDKIKKQLKRFHRLPFYKKHWKAKTLQIFEDILLTENIFCVHQSMSKAQIMNFKAEIMDFLRETRTFAPDLAFGDIGQAIRNYIVYAMFKQMHQDQSGLNQAAFGYSMLYPFTDNFIDNKSNSAKEKKDYNQLIRDHLEGKEPIPSSKHQQKTCELLQAIETVYPRKTQNSIFNLLLMMLEAQEFSIQQQHKDHPLTTEERLDISVFKGGISVFIDRYFVKKEITEQDIFFYLGFGYFLQLADDLQDIKEDNSRGHSTLFTINTNSESEEKLVNKILHYLHDLMTNFHPENNQFKNFILSSSYLLVLSSVLSSKEFFSPEYINKIETYLPVSKSYLENMLNNKIENMDAVTQEKYMKLLDELLVS
jgi:hypothetical protein